VNVALRKKQLKKDDDLDIGQIARGRGQGFAQSVSDMALSGEIDPKGFWARAAKARMKQAGGVTSEMRRGKYLGELEKQLSDIDTSKLPAHKRGRLAAIKKHAKQMRESQKTGTLTADAEKRGVGKAAVSAFGLLGDERKGKNLFDLAARSNDHLTRDEMKRSFGKRGLVSDVAAERGMAWDQAAKGLGSLGLIDKKDPRLAVTGKQISAQKNKPDLLFDDAEVKTGTAATSVMQMGRSLDEASASIGNRLNAAYKEVGGAKTPKEAGQKAAHHHDRAALAEATGIANLRAGGSKKTSMALFAISGANSAKSQEARMSQLAKTVKKDILR
jgi:hypothetical protein